MYTPLYIKTNNNILSSIIKIDELVKFALDNNLKSLTITDSNMYGAYDFYKECRNGLPSVGDNINTNDVTGKVIDVDILKRSYKVEKDNGTVVEIKL